MQRIIDNRLFWVTFQVITYYGTLSTVLTSSEVVSQPRFGSIDVELKNAENVTEIVIETATKNCSYSTITITFCDETTVIMPFDQNDGITTDWFNVEPFWLG